MINLSRSLALSIATVITASLVSTQSAQANSLVKHVQVHLGICLEPGPGTASASVVKLGGTVGVQLSSGNGSAFDTTAGAALTFGTVPIPQDPDMELLHQSRDCSAHACVICAFGWVKDDRIGNIVSLRDELYSKFSKYSLPMKKAVWHGRTSKLHCVYPDHISIGCDRQYNSCAIRPGRFIAFRVRNIGII